ncbi:P-loop containing nucleoside triphosphate hydrolase protein [Mycena metata]|uniref:P-loop containing nucleoside triphosphate hydrolase protein n=1 Tax=Mycena metata TaxID=1033252 RepID=A0AAD7H4N0_9AGAR|nr:P-loop containing nucleoside triphosphate hydrolase protein [Mycena metata]
MANDVTIMLGETGSGKTTQVPQYLLEAGFADAGMIGVTQPRKVAATALATRVSVEQGTPLGGLVGYGIRFDEKTSPATRVKYMTDGMLTRELLWDPLLSKYAVIIVDEAHERTLQTDLKLLLANLKRILRERNGKEEGKPQVNGKGKEREKERNPFKVVIMSATLDAKKFSQFFSNAKIVHVKGRQHPVQIFHATEDEADYVDAALRTFFQIHVDEPPGDDAGHDEVLPLPMYAALPTAQLHHTFAPTPPQTRKCILATNIAQTSITIPGVRYVIDTGKVKEKRYVAGSTGGGVDTLLTRDISKSNAMQRTGRAGREGPGFCYRLYTEEGFLGVQFGASHPPTVVYGARYPRPGFNGYARCGCGLFCPTRPLHPRRARLPPRADRSRSRHGRSPPRAHPRARSPRIERPQLHGLNCTAEVLDIVSVLAANGALFLTATDKRPEIAEARREFVHPSGDHLTILSTVRAYRAAGGAGRSARQEWAWAHFVNERTLRDASSIRNQLRLSCTRAGIDWRASCGEQEEPALLSLAHGLAQNTAVRTGVISRFWGTRWVLKIHPGSSMVSKKVPAIIYDELVCTNLIYARGVSSISLSSASLLAVHQALYAGIHGFTPDE